MQFEKRAKSELIFQKGKDDKLQKENT